MSVLRGCHGASLAASSPCRSARLDRYRGRGQLRVPPDHRSGARWNALHIPVGRCLIPSIGSARGVVLLKNGIDRSGVNRKRLRQEPVSLGIVALSLFMEPLFGQSPGVRRYGLGIAAPHIVILHVVVHMDLPCRDNSRPQPAVRAIPFHKAARNWSCFSGSGPRNFLHGGTKRHCHATRSGAGDHNPRCTI